MVDKRTLAAFLLLLCAADVAEAARKTHRSRRQRRVYSNEIFTIEPGTVELEFGTNTGSDAFTMPTTLKYEPDFASPLLRQIELSLSSDTFTLLNNSGTHTVQFAGQQTAAVLRPIFQREGFAVALQPQVVFSIRGGESPRFGSAVLAGWAHGAHSLVGTVTWTAATHSSDSNPAQQYDYDAAYVYAIAKSRYSILTDLQWSTAHRQPSQGFLTLGMVCRIRPTFSLDAGLREQGVGTSQRHPHLLAGFTWNLGRVGRRVR
jgi:hypothetical protein